MEYRDCEIYWDDLYHVYRWQHEDFDPTPLHSYDPPNTDGSGEGKTVEDCKAEIDEWWLDAA